ncbi:MAG: SGNH/GDSL hydrolase family protein [Planctomycetes bacterium]|nr:SGNH/GDSL hydrolase family protein [Planctomycetota bacterium]NBY03326.1 SGNH/GDSL hydrolase family protein [Planctomycetota bacterium]
MLRTLFFLHMICLFPAYAQSTKKSGEPSNAEELAKKKAAADKATNEKFQLWKSKLPKEQQAWENILEKNLGAFYLPIYQMEKLNNRISAWDYVKDDPKLPRVLLIGDSVSRGYTLPARVALERKANLHRAPENCGPAANGIKKMDVWLGEGKWDVIHFNFGIHDRKTSPKDYEGRLELIVKQLKATGAKLIWASTTPIPPDTKDGPEATTAIIEKNRIAAEIMKKNMIHVNDLFTFITPQLSKVQNPMDVHFKGEGYDMLGRQVALEIEKVLKTK